MKRLLILLGLLMALPVALLGSPASSSDGFGESIVWGREFLNEPGWRAHNHRSTPDVPRYLRVTAFVRTIGVAYAEQA